MASIIEWGFIEAANTEEMEVIWRLPILFHESETDFKLFANKGTNFHLLSELPQYFPLTQLF